MVSVFNLPFVPWEGGPQYWSQFSKASAAGWTNPSFFPISVFLSSANPAHVASLKDAGINTYMDVEHDPGTFPLTNITNQGMFAMTSWSASEVGNNPNAVGWFISDEADMGLGVSGANEDEWFAEQQRRVNQRKALGDGRYTWANYGNGILRTWWSPNRMDDFVRVVDGASADKYTYTSPDVANIIDGVHDAPDWPNGVPVPRAYSYGWQVDQMLRFQEPGNIRPIWTFIETAKPYLTESGARSIQPDQIEGAVWSAIIHGARGIAYFQHNNDGRGNYSIIDIPVVHNKVKAINAKVKSLAPVLNSQSRYNTTRTVNGFTFYEYTFNNGTDTRVITSGSDVYVIAGIGMGHSTGNKTFTVPEGVTVTNIEVVGEGRTIAVSNNSWVDSFPNEYTHHVYKLSSTTPAPNPDTQAPAIVTNVNATSITQTGFSLSWNPSTDNVGVVRYEVRDGNTVVSATATSPLNVTGLQAGTSHSMTVRAYDAAGNFSTSAATVVSTLPVVPDPDPDPDPEPAENAPTFVVAVASTLNGTATPKTVTVAVQAGDLLVVAGGAENALATLSTPTASGVNFTLQRSSGVGAGDSQAPVYVWTGEASSTGNLTISVARSATSVTWGFSVTVWRDHNGIGAVLPASSSGTAATAPLANLTVAANSAIVAAVADWRAVTGARQYRGTNPVEDANYADGVTWGFHAWHIVDAGDAGSKEVGMSSPSTQRWNMVAVEVLGTPEPDPDPDETTAPNFIDENGEEQAGVWTVVRNGTEVPVTWSIVEDGTEVPYLGTE